MKSNAPWMKMKKLESLKEGAKHNLWYCSAQHHSASRERAQQCWKWNCCLRKLKMNDKVHLFSSCNTKIYHGKESATRRCDIFCNGGHTRANRGPPRWELLDGCSLLDDSFSCNRHGFHLAGCCVGDKKKRQNTGVTKSRSKVRQVKKNWMFCWGTPRER